MKNRAYKTTTLLSMTATATTIYTTSTTTTTTNMIWIITIKYNYFSYREYKWALFRVLICINKTKQPHPHTRACFLASGFRPVFGGSIFNFVSGLVSPRLSLFSQWSADCQADRSQRPQKEKQSFQTHTFHSISVTHYVLPSPSSGITSHAGCTNRVTNRRSRNTSRRNMLFHLCVFIFRRFILYSIQILSG